MPNRSVPAPIALAFAAGMQGSLARRGRAAMEAGGAAYFPSPRAAMQRRYPATNAAPARSAAPLGVRSTRCETLGNRGSTRRAKHVESVGGPATPHGRVACTRTLLLESGAWCQAFHARQARARLEAGSVALNLRLRLPVPAGGHGRDHLLLSFDLFPAIIALVTNGEFCAGVLLSQWCFGPVRHDVSK